MVPTVEARSGSPPTNWDSNRSGVDPVVVACAWNCVELVGTRYTGRLSLTGRLSVAPLTAPSVNDVLPGSRASGKNISGAVPVFFTVT